MARYQKQSTRWGVVVGAALAIVLSGAIQARAEQTEEFHKTYPLAANGRVELRNINGGIKITGWDRNEVQVDAVKTGDSKQVLDEARIEVNASANSIDIRTRYPDDNENSRHHAAKVEYTLHVPRTAQLDQIENINGGVSVQGVNGNIHISSVNGEVVAQDAKNDLKLASVNGRVRGIMTTVSPSQNISLDCVNGSVELTLPSHSNVELNASTVHGSISNDFNMPVKRGFVGNNLQAKLGDGATHAKLNTVNGSIRIQHASDGKPLSKVTNLLPEGRHFD